MYLGEIIVPHSEDWVPNVTYRPEPPIVVRGSLNPWAQERKREQWLAEEAAWKKITALQARWRSQMAGFNVVKGRYNRTIGELEGLTGSTGLIRVKGPIGMVISPVNMVFSLIDTLTFGVFGSGKKKKKIKSLTRDLETMQVQLRTYEADFSAMAADMSQLVAAGKIIQDTQRARTDADVKQSEALYAQRVSKQREQGSQHAALVRYYANTQPSRQRTHDAL